MESCYEMSFVIVAIEDLGKDETPSDATLDDS